MTEFAECLRAARKNARLTVREVVSRLETKGVTISEKTLYGWENGVRTPDGDVFLTLCEIYDVRSLAEFRGTPTLISMEDRDTIKKYRVLDAHGKRLVRLIVEEESRRMAEEEENEAVSPVIYAAFRVSEQAAAAGLGITLGDDAFSFRQVPASLLPKNASFGVPVSGDSMEPLYHNGDILLVDSDQEPAIGEVGVFLLDGKGFVKKRGTDALISLNPKYAPIPLDSETRSFGRVIGALRADVLQ